MFSIFTILQFVIFSFSPIVLTPSFSCMMFPNLNSILILPTLIATLASSGWQFKAGVQIRYFIIEPPMLSWWKILFGYFLGLNLIIFFVNYFCFTRTSNFERCGWLQIFKFKYSSFLEECFKIILNILKYFKIQNGLSIVINIWVFLLWYKWDWSKVTIFAC